MTAQIINITAMVKKLENPPNRIREVRTAKKLPLKYIADRMQTTTTQIGRFETGERPVKLETMRRIADILDVDVARLLNPEDNPFSLSEQEMAVIEAMRDGGSQVADAIQRVAEGLRGFTPMPGGERSTS